MGILAILQFGTFLGAWMFGAIAFPLAAFLWYFLAFPYLAVALICYSGFRMIVPRRRWPWMHQQQAAWTKRHKYCRTQRIVCEEELPKPHTKALLCFHPHGIICTGWSLNGNSNEALIPCEISFLGADILFKLPLVSDMLTWYGCGPASKKNMLQLMAKDHNLALLPGGFEEATFYRFGRHRVFLKTRAGFVKYALQNGYSLFPVYTFGEERTFWAASGLMEKFAFLNKYKLPSVIFAGKWCSFLPDDNIDLVTVIGKPLVLPKIENPTKADVNKYHLRYIAALRATFQRHRKEFAFEGDKAVLEVL